MNSLKLKQVDLTKFGIIIMQQNKVATVYAQSLLEIGKERNTLGAIKEDLEAAGTVFKEFSEFENAFLSPRISQRNKISAINNVFKDRIQGVVLNFLKILIRKKREDQFENIQLAYNELLDEALNRIHVAVKTAIEPDNDFLPRIEKIISQKSGKEAVVHLETDPKILGGAVIQIADVVADLSVSRELELLKEKIISCELRSEEVYEN